MFGHGSTLCCISLEGLFCIVTWSGDRGAVGALHSTHYRLIGYSVGRVPHAVIGIGVSANVKLHITTHPRPVFMHTLWNGCGLRGAISGDRCGVRCMAGLRWCSAPMCISSLPWEERICSQVLCTEPDVPICMDSELFCRSHAAR